MCYKKSLVYFCVCTKAYTFFMKCSFLIKIGATTFTKLYRPTFNKNYVCLQDE